MCRKEISNKNGNFNREATVRCPRCNAKVPIKIGSKNNGNGYNREVKCTSCPNIIRFNTDESGKVHLLNGHLPKRAHTPKYPPREE